MSELDSTQPKLTATQQGEAEHYEIGGDPQEVGKTIKALLQKDRPLAAITWERATVDSHDREIVVEGVRPNGRPCCLTIHVAHTRANTARDDASLITHTAATVACLGFGNGENDNLRYWNVLSRLIEDTRPRHTFGGLIDRRTL